MIALSSSGSARQRRGVVLLLGAVVVALVVAPIGPARLYWMPLVLGLTYLTAAGAGGRDGAFWAAGLVVTSWGIAVLLVLTGTVHADFAATAVVGLGAGALFASLWPGGASATGVAVPVLLVGVLELAQAQLHGVFDRGWAYGVLLAGWGAWELRPERPSPRSAGPS